VEEGLVSLSFSDTVRSVEQTPECVEVTFWTQAAFYRVAEGPMAAALSEAQATKKTVRVTFDGATMEILSVS
jgi:hypothetical protein